MGKKQGVRIKQIGPKGMPAGGAMNPMADMMGGLMGEDTPSLPPQPVDKNLVVRCGVPEDAGIDGKWEGFWCVWPNHLDSSKTVKQGRMISKLDSPGESITFLDIIEACKSLKIPHAFEPHKCYPRDPESHWYNMGRIRIPKQFELWSSRGEMLRVLAKQIEEEEGRVLRMNQKKEEDELLEEEIRKTTHVGNPQTVAKKVGNSKKKGKKKR